MNGRTRLPANLTLILNGFAIKSAYRPTGDPCRHLNHQLSGPHNFPEKRYSFIPPDVKVSLRALAPTIWLDDDCINAYLGLVESRCQELAPELVTKKMLSWFMGKLEEQGHPGAMAGKKVSVLLSPQISFPALWHLHR